MAEKPKAPNNRAQAKGDEAEARDKTVFAGEPDGRQAETTEPTLFRKRYRQLSAAELKLHDGIKEHADGLAGLFLQVMQFAPPASQQLPPRDMIAGMAENRGANVTLALRHLEDAVYRAVKALTT